MEYSELKYGKLYADNRLNSLMKKNHRYILFMDESSIKIMIFKNYKALSISNVSNLKEKWNDEEQTYSSDILEANNEDKRQLFSLLFKEYDSIVIKIGNYDF